MRRSILLFPLLIFLSSVYSFAQTFSSSIFSEIVLPNLGFFKIGEVQVEVVPSPLTRVADRVGEGAVINSEDEEKWKKIYNRRWLVVVLKNPSTLEIVVPEIPPKPPLDYSYSVYVSKNGEPRGFLFGQDRLINFGYFTVNIVAKESAKIEAKRFWLDQRAKSKEKIKLRAKLVRLETHVLNLFDNSARGEWFIEFIDFYLADIEFLEN